MSTEIIQSDTITAMKQHRCDYCGMRIHPGKKYRRSVIKNSGDVYTWKSHECCHLIAEAMNMFEATDNCVGMADFQDFVLDLFQESDQKPVEFAERMKAAVEYAGAKYKIDTKEINP